MITSSGAALSTVDGPYCARVVLNAMPNVTPELAACRRFLGLLLGTLALDRLTFFSFACY